MRSWLSLVRIEYSTLVFVGVVAGAALASGSLSGSYVWRALGLALVAGAVFAHNDFIDLAGDKALGRRERPLVTGAITPDQALFTSVLLFAAGLFVSFIAGGLLGIVVVALSLIGVAYNAFLKRVPLIGNMIVAAYYSVPLLYGNVVADGSFDNLRPYIVLFASGAFLAGLGRELLGSAKDVEGDRVTGVSSLPMLVGEELALKLIVSLWVLAVIVSLLVPLIGYFSLPYVLLIGLFDVVLLSSGYSILKDSSHLNLARA